MRLRHLTSAEPSTVHAAAAPAHRLLEQASQIHQDRAELGEAATRKLLEKCVENTRSLLKVETQQKGHKRSLENADQKHRLKQATNTVQLAKAHFNFLGLGVSFHRY